MGVLTEYVRKEAEQLKKEIHKREEAVKEWTAAVGRLYDQIERWIKDADSGVGLLHVGRLSRPTFQEPRLGGYELDCLGIAIGDGGISSRRAEIRPRARHVIAAIRPPGKEPRRADGMVEIRSGTVADYYLFRLIENGEDRWYIQSVAKWNSDSEYGIVEELDRERFEAAILNVIQ
jgi:hypothetical protein